VIDTASALPLIQGLASLHDSVLLLDPRGRVFWMSDALAERCSGEELRGRPWTQLFVDDAASRKVAATLCATGRLSNASVVLRRSNGRSIPATISAARLGADPESCPVVAILRIGDDASRRELEATLASSRVFLDISPDAVVVVDPSRFILYANAATEHVLGYAPEELRDHPLALFVRGTQDVERIAEALSPESPVRNQDLEVRHRDGHTLCVSVSASLLRFADGTVAGAVAYLRDVTERRRTEESLARKNAELEHYVHAVSHDLRSPLVSLLGFSRLLREDYGDRLDAKGLHFLERVEQAGRTMEALIRDLLELSRIGRTGQATTRVSPRPVLLQLQAELKPRLDAEGVALVLPEDPPSLQCDRTRLYQLFSNLIGNALEHMGRPPAPRIEVEVREDGEGHLIAVSDNGRGIQPEHHERVFEIFQSLSPRRDGARGTGMGLSIVRKIAETQGGRAWVESEPGRGARFLVRLPASR
jgi:PAS domain S-box-containing protein